MRSASSTWAGGRRLADGPRQHDQLIGKLGRQVEIVQHHQGDPLLLPGLLAEVFHQLHLVVKVQGADRLVQHHDAGSRSSTWANSTICRWPPLKE